VRFFQAFADFGADFQHLLGGQRAFLNAGRERFALQKFHDQEISAVLVAHVVQMADIRVRQRRDGARFAIETLLGLRIGGKMGR
jgi:hypothetical protein